MNDFAIWWRVELLKQGFHTKRNNPEMTLHEVVYDSNAWQPNIHVALHSNAAVAVD